MSAFQAKAAWTRLQALIPGAREEFFGLPRRTFYNLRSGGRPAKRTLLAIIERYQLDADYVLYSKSPLGFVEQFPLAVSRAIYADSPEPLRQELFAFVALNRYLGLRKRYSDASFLMKGRKHAQISIPLQGEDAILVELDAVDEIILTLRLNLGDMAMPLLSAQNLPASMEKFYGIIARHKRGNGASKTAAFDKSRKESQEFMSSWHYQTHKNTDDQQP